MRVQISLELERISGTAILAQRPGLIDVRGPLVDLTPTMRQVIADISDSQDHFTRQLTLHGYIPGLDPAALQGPRAYVPDPDAWINGNDPFADVGDSNR